MKSCNFLLPSLPRPPQREWVVSSPRTAFTRSTTLRSFKAHIFVRKSSKEGAARESGNKRTKQNELHAKITVKAPSLEQVVAMNMGE